MQINDYLYNLTQNQAAIVQYLHEIISENPGIELKRRWHLPFYFRNSWICYFNLLKNGNVEWAFTRGNELGNANGWLDSRGRKQIYSVNFESVSDIEREVAHRTLQEALLLDEQVPYSARKRTTT